MQKSTHASLQHVSTTNAPVQQLLLQHSTTQPNRFKLVFFLLFSGKRIKNQYTIKTFPSSSAPVNTTIRSGHVVILCNIYLLFHWQLSTDVYEYKSCADFDRFFSQKLQKDKYDSQKSRHYNKSMVFSIPFPLLCPVSPQ